MITRGGRIWLAEIENFYARPAERPCETPHGSTISETQKLSQSDAWKISYFVARKKCPVLSDYLYLLFWKENVLLSFYTGKVLVLITQESELALISKGKCDTFISKESVLPLFSNESVLLLFRKKSALPLFSKEGLLPSSSKECVLPLVSNIRRKTHFMFLPAICIIWQWKHFSAIHPHIMIIIMIRKMRAANFFCSDLMA